MRTLVITGQNLIPNNINKNIYRYFFANSIKFYLGEKIALMNLLIPYSWYNITSDLLNNSLQVIYNGLTTNLIIPDGYYTISTLNSFLKSQALLSSNNIPYVTNSNGDAIYFYELILNTSFYSIQLNLYPCILGSYSNPKNATFTGNTLLIRINTKLSDLIGLLPNINYPTNVQNTTFSIYSAQLNLIPNFSGDSNSIIIECNIVSNSLGSTSKLLYSFSPVDTTYGRNIVVSPNEYSFIEILESNFQYIDITFKDSVLNNLKIRDSNICLQLIFKGVNE